MLEVVAASEKGLHFCAVHVEEGGHDEEDRGGEEEPDY